MARPELLDSSPGWGGGKFNATSVLLEPLDEHESIELLDNLLGQQELAAIRNRVAEAAEGNPLFAEEMLAMLIDDGVLMQVNGGWTATGDPESITVPPSIHALLSARLERLADAERAVVECASIEGKVFHRGAVALLFGDEAGGHLHALVRKELVRPEATDLPGEDAFRFRHLLIRDAAYESMPKERRAQLHARFAAWLESAVGERAAEYDEVLGHHLGQAYRYRVELGPPDDDARSLAVRAGEHLGSAAARAFGRGDATAAVRLFEHAVEVLPPEHARRPGLLCDLGLALTDHGDLARAGEVLRKAAETGDPATSATAALRLEWLELTGSGEIGPAGSRIDHLARELEKLGDDVGLAEASLMQGIILSWKGRCAEALTYYERAAELALAVGNPRARSRALSWMLITCYWGPMPVPEGLELCDRIASEAAGNRYVEAYAEAIGGALEAMAGDWAESERRSARGHEILDDLGQHVSSAAIRMTEAEAHFFGGRGDYAERELRRAYEPLKAVGDRGYLSTVTAMLALALCAREEYDEAERYAEEARELGAADDLVTETFRHGALAEIHASRSDFEQAHAAIQEAHDLLAESDMIGDKAVVLFCEAAVLRHEGKPDEARIALESAIDLWRQKGASSAVVWLEGLL